MNKIKLEFIMIVCLFVCLTLSCAILEEDYQPVTVSTKHDDSFVDKLCNGNKDFYQRRGKVRNGSVRE
jgi:hypothetical protein